MKKTVTHDCLGSTVSHSVADAGGYTLSHAHGHTCCAAVASTSLPMAKQKSL